MGRGGLNPQVEIFFFKKTNLVFLYYLTLGLAHSLKRDNLDLGYAFLFSILPFFLATAMNPPQRPNLIM